MQHVKHYSCSFTLEEVEWKWRGTCSAETRLVSRVRVYCWSTGRTLLSSWRDRIRQQPWGTVSGLLKFITWQKGGSRHISHNANYHSVTVIIGINGLNSVSCKYNRGVTDYDFTCPFITWHSGAHLHYSLQLLWESGVRHCDREEMGVRQP